VTDPAEVTHLVRASQGNAIDVKIVRKGKPLSLSIAPRKVSDGVYMIGVRFGQARARGPILGAVKEAVVMPIALSAVLLKNIWDLITRKIQGGLTGPLGIAKEMAGAAKQGLLKFLEILILISVALGVFNLLPVPGLDGARIFFVGINAIRRKDINPAVETKIHMVGIMVLLMVLVVVTFKDIKHIWLRLVGTSAIFEMPRRKMLYRINRRYGAYVSSPPPYPVGGRLPPPPCTVAVVPPEVPPEEPMLPWASREETDIPVRMPQATQSSPKTSAPPRQSGPRVIEWALFWGVMALGPSCKRRESPAFANGSSPSLPAVAL
jgi:hypothetical protein